MSEILLADMIYGFSRFLITLAMFVINLYAYYRLLVAMRSNYQPWQNGMSGVGAIATMLGFGLLMAVRGLFYSPAPYAFILLGCALMLFPKLWERTVDLSPPRA